LPFSSVLLASRTTGSLQREQIGKEEVMLDIKITNRPIKKSTILVAAAEEVERDAG
jgi:hypothetical protein